MVEKAIVFMVLISLGFTNTSAQEISGTWVGNDERTIFIVHPTKIVVELNLQNDTLLTGVTHYYYKDGSYEHFKISGRFSPIDSLIIFSEDSAISIKKKKDYEMFESVYTMRLRNVGGKLQMKGKLKEKGKGLFRTTLEASFEKEQSNSNLTKLTARDSTREAANVPAIPSPSPTVTRVVDVQKVIEIDEHERDSIKIELFDNGIVDDDTVSIYLNGVELLKHQRVSEKPIIFYTSLNKDVKFQKITMVADNLGRIPPNTALLVITTKEKKYDVYLSSDLSKNAVVEFFFKE